MPGMTVIPYAAAATVAGATLAIVSWSVTLIVRMPACQARSTSDSGVHVPSEAVVCMCKSITEILLGGWTRIDRRSKRRAMAKDGLGQFFAACLSWAMNKVCHNPDFWLAADRREFIVHW